MDTQKARKPRKRPGKVGENKSEIVREVPLACADESAAVEFMEKRRWGSEPCCPHCGGERVYKMTGRDSQREKHYRWRCRECKRQFSVRTGTVFEDSRIPMRHWAFAFWAACASKKGVSAKQIQRQTWLSYKSALFMMHRIRFAMTEDTTTPPKLSGVVEADETWIGGKPRGQKRSERMMLGDRKADGRRNWRSNKPVVAAAVERGGNVRAQVIAKVNRENLEPFLLANLEPGCTLMTDEHTAYQIPAWKLRAIHKRVTHHLGEYVRQEGDETVTTNQIEGFFGLFKRKLNGTHHSVSPAHLWRYLAEAAFIYNHRQVDDGARTEAAIRAAQGKRLTYREPQADSA